MKLKDVVVKLKQIRDMDVDVRKARTEAFVVEADKVAMLEFNQLIFAWGCEGERDFTERDRIAIKTFLEHHWLAVARTNADYFMNPHGRMTAIFKALAQLTVDALFRAARPPQNKKEARLDPWLAVMVPTLSAPALRQHFNDQFDFYNYVIPKDLQTLVDIRNAFQHGQVKPTLGLEESVIARVQAHDPITTQMLSLKHKPQRTRTQLETELKLKMFDEREKLNSSYPLERSVYLEEMTKRRAEENEKKWTELAQLADVQTFMTDYLLCSQWPRFVNVLGEVKINSLVSSMPSALDLPDVPSSRALAYLCIQDYITNRQVQGEHTSSIAKLSSLAMTIPKKDEKLAVAQTMLTALAEGDSLDDVADYLNSDQLSKEQKQAAIDGSLGLILKKFFIENPSLPLKPEPQPSVGYFSKMSGWLSMGLFGGAQVASQPRPETDLGQLAHRPS